MVFEFSVIRLGTGNGFGAKYIYQPFPLSQLRALTAKWQTFIEGTDGWTTVFCENHDNGRAVSRFGDASSPELWRASAKVIALWQATLTGTLFLYQGQEIGMTNMPKTWGIEEYKDIESSNFYVEALESGDEKRIRATMEGLQILARDHARIPFQWDSSANAGFSAAGATPWMRVHDDSERINVESQMGDSDSILAFYKTVLGLRKQHRDLFIHGAFRLLEPESEQAFAYIKESAMAVDSLNGARRKALVIMNFSNEDVECLDVGGALGCKVDQARLLVSTSGRDSAPSGAGDAWNGLKGWEGRVYVNFA
jgi:alpha-glucosidase